MKFYTLVAVMGLLLAGCCLGDVGKTALNQKTPDETPPREQEEQEAAPQPPEPEPAPAIDCTGEDAQSALVKVQEAGGLRIVTLGQALEVEGDGSVSVLLSIATEDGDNVGVLLTVAAPIEVSGEVTWLVGGIERPMKAKSSIKQTRRGVNSERKAVVHRNEIARWATGATEVRIGKVKATLDERHQRRLKAWWCASLGS